MANAGDGRPRFFVSAAEPSADRHAASLIREIGRLCPGASFFGVAGPLMQASGCQVLEDWTSRSTMLVGAVRLAGQAYRLLGRVSSVLRDRPADLAILVDSPALHLPMARRLKKTGCPVLYYIAPQLWAWAPWRIRKVRRRVDRVACILPFEEEYFRQRGVAARYVGHPLVEQLAGASPAEDVVARLKMTGQPLIACLPGSRRHVIEEVLPGQIEVARAIARRHGGASFVFAAAGDAAASQISAALTGESFRWQVAKNQLRETLAAADLSLCASGTATLEVACHGVPMVVMYNGSKWGYRLVGRFLITTPHLSLVNILAGRRVVPEFMPYYDSTEPIAAEALDILGNAERRAAIQADLRSVVASLGTSRAAEETARMALEMIGQRR